MIASTALFYWARCIFYIENKACISKKSMVDADGRCVRQPFLYFLALFLE
jgi:hypothetical protein